MKAHVRLLNSEFLILNVLLLAACGSDNAASRSRPPVDVPAGRLTIALAGDVSFNSLEGAASNAFDLIRNANLGFANLEVNLLDPSYAREAAARPAPRWIFAADSDAARLRDLGFDLVSLANNHAMDFGADGLTSTTTALDGAGILHAGAGADLAAARAAAFAGGGARRVALIAVTASASDQARASASQQDIQGRAGVSPLIFDAAITVDAATYRTLAESVQALGAGPPPGEHEMTMFGRRITKGEATNVAFRLSAADEEQVLAAVRDARTRAELVIVSVHSHEPFNDTEDPASFVRQFAHDAVDAGAQLVVGHGPHRMRGAELYNAGVIFYSLGNFVYRTTGLDFRAADQFDAGNNLYTAALGAASSSSSPFGQLDRDWWWQAVAATVTVENGAIIEAKLYPVTLKVSDQLDRRGVPQLANGAEANTILRQFSALSKRLGTDLGDDTSSLVLQLPIPKNR